MCLYKEAEDKLYRVEEGRCALIAELGLGLLVAKKGRLQACRVLRARARPRLRGHLVQPRASRFDATQSLEVPPTRERRDRARARPVGAETGDRLERRSG